MANFTEKESICFSLSPFWDRVAAHDLGTSHYWGNTAFDGAVMVGENIPCLHSPTASATELSQQAETFQKICRLPFCFF